MTRLPDGHPFFEKCEAGNLAEVQKYFSDGLDVNVVGETKPPAITCALSQGNAEFVALLLENGWDINQRRGRFQLTALLTALRRPDPAMARFLIESGADVTLCDVYGFSPVMIAASNGDVGMLEILARKGADISAVTSQELDALFFACEQEQTASMEWLLDNGVSIERILGESGTPLIQTVKAGKREMARWLLNKGANRNAKDQYGKTALDWSRENGQVDIEKLLNE